MPWHVEKIRECNSMRRTCSITLFAATLFMIYSPTAFAAECSNEVKRALTNSKWTLTTEYNDGAKAFPTKTRVAADGTMAFVRYGKTIKITCDSKEIVFDWKNQESKRYTLTLGKDGVFSGSRSSNYVDGYPATLKKR